MTKSKLATLGGEVRKRRQNNTLRDTAKGIGISPATLLRVEAGRVPDVETFGKICKWLGTDPGVYLGFTSESDNAAVEASLLTISAHFKADATPNLETANALAHMIMVAVRRQSPTLTDGDA